jgi:glucose/arabinose dehydrogenase
MKYGSIVRNNMVLINKFVIFYLLFCHLGCRVETETLKGDSDNGGLYLPDNFKALVIVDSLGPTRHIAVNKNGDIYAQLNYPDDGKGTIGLRDINKDGKADSIVHFGDYVDRGRAGTGISIYNGYLYTTTRKYIYRNKLKAGELVPLGETEIVFTDTDKNLERNWHTAKPLAFDNKGYMYVPFGAPTDACQDVLKYGPNGIPGGSGLDPCPELEAHAGIWRFDANKTDLTLQDGYKFASGIRSVVGIEWNPRDNNLYAVGHGIDNFHTIYPNLFSSFQAAILPAETLLKVTEGSDYGWPYAYYDHIQKKNVLQPGYGGDGKMVGRASLFDVPMMGFEGHWAPMDVMFYHGDQFPERYKNGAFIAFHGSTDRPPYPQAGFIVCFVPFENGKAIGKWEVFADGFTRVDTVVNTNDAKYRPMSLSTGPDGSIYISESNQGKIWRIMYKGDKDIFGEAELASMEERKSKPYIKRPIEGQDDLKQGGELSGRILYNIYCAGCHQSNGRGDNNRYPTLRNSEWVTGDEDRLIDVVLNGMQGEINVNGRIFNGVMPSNTHLNDLVIASILTYIRNNFTRKNYEPIKVDNVTKIRNLNKKK